MQAWVRRCLNPTLGYRLALGALVLCAAYLRFANLAALGYGNHYYTAAVASMLQSGRNFFFVAAEPGASVTVDKPPVGLWLQAFSAWGLGVNGFAVILPQIIAGLLSVLVLAQLVRRSFGAVAGLIAAFVLATTPVVVATDRNNTMDSTLVLVLLLAAWAVVKATERAQLRFLLLGAALIGVGFEIKMLQAYLVIPCLSLLYLVGTPLRWWHKLLHLLAASLVLVIVSFAWAVAVDRTPTDQRPFIGSSTNNTVLELVIGHNGIDRLLGKNALANPRSAAAAQLPAAAEGMLPPPINGQGFADGQSPSGGPSMGAGPQMDGRMQPPGAGPGNEVGQPGLTRLFTAPLNNEASWLLPFALLSSGVLVARTRLRQPRAPAQQGLLLWGGWLLTTAIFFSMARFFHAYYMSMLAPPLAALVGIGTVTLWRLREHHSWRALLLLVGSAGVTLCFQWFTALHYIGNAWWLTVPLGFLLSGALLLLVRQFKPQKGLVTSGFALIIAAILVIPTGWAGLTTFDTNPNVALPSAYEGPGMPQENGLRINQALLAYLTPRTTTTSYLLAVPSAMQGSDYVLATGRPVLYIGGFNGQDQVVTSADLAALVAAGKLRYIYWGDNNDGGLTSKPAITQWVTSACVPVEGFTSASNSGRPEDVPLTLYACGG